MKLISKITLLYLLISLLAFLLGGVISYQVIKREMTFEEQRFLEERLAFTLRMIEKRKPEEPFVRDKITIVPLGSQAAEVPVAFSDTLLMHATLGRMEPHTQLKTVQKVGDEYYKITLYDLIIEEDDIEEGVVESLIKMYLLLTVFVLILGWTLSNWLLKPFNRTLQQIRNFSLEKDKGIPYRRSTTREFDKLNLFLKEMTTKIQSDYRSLREFAENASHEMQTPLSIARGKLELLLESENLTDQQVEYILSAQQSLRRLSKMNKSLLLLTRIENKEFADANEINLSELLDKLLQDFNELIDLKGLQLEKAIEPNVYVKVDGTLGALMLSNLIANAINHNYEGGYIKTVLDKGHFTIRNSGNQLSSDPDQLFQRFRKDNQSKDSVGLGLSIVKKICEVSGFKISYQHVKGQHSIQINFADAGL